MHVDRWSDAAVPDARELRRRLESEGFSVFQWSDPPGRVYPPHAHGDNQSHWIVRGSMALTVDGEEYILGPGDRDYLPAGTVHSARVVSPEPVVYLIVAK